ncbi:hypothetical protein [Roseofilum capinflatum]|uniref:Uncharacterized protein n=1 Tax=Roseofilum capinflatum BLCC-M114 TaxID=3022440 RepID=A0ABT7B2X6_9CYAN|nr:hypothetical protein [Roseofilum capinflatum]MDJ1173517.1 hypothetical protein [Roseofilum capinflatum BLCC-M114]
MSKHRWFILGILSFFGFIFAHGSWINRLLAVILCGLLGADSGLCMATAAKYSGKTVAATPAMVEEILLVQRSREFDDPPVAPPPGNSQPVPAFPQDAGPDYIRPDFGNPIPNQATRDNSISFELNSKNAVLTISSETGCFESYNFEKSREGHAEIKRIEMNIPGNSICDVQSPILNIQFGLDKQNKTQLKLSSTNQAPSILVRGVDSSTWQIEYVNELGNKEVEVVEINSLKGIQSLKSLKQRWPGERCLLEKGLCDNLKRLDDLPGKILGELGLGTAVGNAFSKLVGWNQTSTIITSTGTRTLASGLRFFNPATLAKAGISLTGPALLGFVILESMRAYFSIHCLMAFGEGYENTWTNLLKKNSDFKNWLDQYPDQLGCIGECGETEIKRGGRGFDSKTFNMGTTSGTVTITYEMCPNPDKLEIFYEGQIIESTGGLVSNSGTLQAQFDGSSSQVEVVISAPNEGTEWAYLVFCPNQEIPRSIGKLRECT